MSICIGIASYGHLYRYIEEIEKELPPDVKLLVINELFEELKTPVKKLEQNHEVDVFVSGGGNADFLEKYLKHIPLVRFEVTGFDLLNALKEAKTFADHVAVISRNTPIPYLEGMDKILTIQMESYTYENLEDLDILLKSLYLQGIRDVIGSVLVQERARLYGMRGYTIRSIDGIRQAIMTAITLARSIKETAEKAQKFNSLLDYSAEGILLTDRNGVITDINASAEKILKRSRKSVVGKFCRDVLPNTQLDTVIREKRPQYNKIQDLGDVRIVTNRSPIMLHGEVIGALATFFSVSSIESAETYVRQFQRMSKHRAKTYFHNLTGASEAFTQMKTQAMRYAASDATVLIYGASGTGKEMLAQSIHNASARKDESFVRIDCPAYSAAALEWELFGYEKGAVPGGNRAGKSGAFELAHRGTLFINEIADIPYKLQGRLLRAIEEKQLLRVGGESEIPVDVRIIACTNRNLRQLVQEGSFREDLYYRLNVLGLRVPTLAERREDIPLHAAQILAQLRPDLTQSEISKAAESSFLRNYDWPGNIRELFNTLERFSVLYHIGEEPENTLQTCLGQDASLQGESKEKQAIINALIEAKGNREQAAAILRMSRTTLWRKLKELNIEHVT